MGKKRTAEREEFLFGMLIGALEHSGYGFSETIETSYPDDVIYGPFTDAYAVIVDRYAEKGDEDYGKQYRVDLDTIAAGIGVIQRAELRPLEDGAKVLHNVKTGQRLGLSAAARKEILEQSRDNDGAQLDVVDALAILECALFGRVAYA